MAPRHLGNRRSSNLRLGNDLAFCCTDHDRRVPAMTMCGGLAAGPDIVPIQS
jgi:hypothetical protein